MGRISVAAGLVFVLAVALGSCGEITEPVPTVEVRVAHAAPGLGTAVVHMNSQPEFQLPAAATGFFVVSQQTILYEFVVGADTAALDVAHEADINGLILLDRDEPTLHYFPLERVLDRVRILAINGDFDTIEPMTIRVEAADTTFEGTVGPGDFFLLEPGPGSFEVHVRAGGSDTFVDLEPFTLISQDHGYLVIAPTPDTAPDPGYARILF